MTLDALDPNSPRARHVLIALERTDLRRALAANLAEDGHDVSVVGSGRQLLGFLRAAVMQDLGFDAIPDAIVTDVRMPRSSGVDALEQVRGLQPRVRVVLVADFGDEVAKRYARWHDAFVVDEPFDLDLLENSVLDALSPEWDRVFEEEMGEYDGYFPIRPRQQGSSRRGTRW